MALPTQQVDIPLIGALDTHGDAKVLPVGRLTRLENAVVDRQGRVARRPGFNVLGNLDTAGAPITAADFLAEFDRQLLLFGQGKAYAYNAGGSALGDWSEVGTHLAARVESQDLFRYEADTIFDGSLSVGRVGDLEVFAWSPTGPGTGTTGVVYSVRSISTGAWLVRSRVLQTTSGRPFITTFNDGLNFTSGVVIWCNNAGALTAYVISDSEGDAAPAPLVVRTGLFLGVGGLQDAITVPGLGGECIVSFRLAAGGYVVEKYGSDLGLIGDQGGGGGAPILVIAGDESTLLLGRVESGALEVRPLQLGNLSPHDDFVKSIPSGVGTLHGACSDTWTSSGAWFVYEAGPNLCAASVEADASVNDSRVVATGPVSAYSQPFRHGARDAACIWTGHTSRLGLRLLRLSDSALLASALGDEPASAFRVAPPIIATRPALGTGRMVAHLVDAGGTISALSLGLSEQVDSPNGPRPVPGRLGPTLVVPGAQVRTFDGVSLVEAGLPQLPSLLAPAIAAGAVEIGTHQWVAVAEWRDAAGNVWRGSPTVPRSATLASASRVTFAVGTVQATAKKGVRLVLFRTEANGTIFYRAAEAANDPTVATVSIADNTPDATLITREQLYTTGDVLEDEAPPSAMLAAAHGGRMWLAGLDSDPYAAAPSKPWTPGVGLGWHQGLRVRVPETGGPITAMAAMDDKLILFTETAVFGVAGQGPTDTGLGAWDGPLLVSQHSGCRNRHSVVAVPDGILFESQAGMRLLTRGLQVVALDEPEQLVSVAGPNRLPAISSAVVLPGQTHVRWTRGTAFDRPVPFGGSSGSFKSSGAVVLDWEAQVPGGAKGLWGLWTTPASRHAVNWDGRWARLGEDSRVHVEGFSGGTPDATAYFLLVETGWIRLAGLAGYQRARRLAVLGVASSGLTLEVAYDDAATYLDTYTSPAPSAAGPVVTDVHLSVQKCMSFRVRVTGGTSLNGFTLQIGAKRGMARWQAVSKRFGQ